MRWLDVIHVLFICLFFTSPFFIGKRKMKNLECEKMGGACKYQNTHDCVILPGECKSQKKHCCRV
uniref:Beta-defensin 33 n=1 Tax=Bos indicus x Bos taurus TaxID=30522 RepID=A0A4W2I0T9_BOBOX